MNRLIGLLSLGDTTPTSQSSQPNATPTKTAWWPFNRDKDSQNSSSSSNGKKSVQKITKNNAKKSNHPIPSTKLASTSPEDENFETIVFKLPPCDPKLKSETQIRKTRRFSRFISHKSVDLVTLAQQAWLGCPNPYRSLVWSYLLGYVPTTTSASTEDKRLASLLRKRTEYSKSLYVSYYSSGHHTTYEYQYPLYKRQEEFPELFTEPESEEIRQFGQNSHNSNLSPANSPLNNPTNVNIQVPSDVGPNERTPMSTISENQFFTPPITSTPHQPNSYTPHQQQQHQHQQQQQLEHTPHHDHLASFELYSQPFEIFSTTQPTQPLTQNLSTPTQHTKSNLNQVSRGDKQLLHQIRLDLPRTLTTYQLIQLPQIQGLLERVLYTWAVRHPAASYVQGMNDLCAMITLIVLEQMMWARVGMTNGYLDVHHYKENVIGKQFDAQNDGGNEKTEKAEKTEKTEKTDEKKRNTSIQSTPLNRESNDSVMNPHIINRNGHQFQMYECEEPVNNFSQAFFDIHLHHHAFSWLFYLSELAGKALESVNTPDDRLLETYTGNYYNINPPKKAKNNHKNDQNVDKSNNTQKSDQVNRSPLALPENNTNQDPQNDDSDDLSQQQFEYIKKSQKSQTEKVPQLYIPSAQHIFLQNPIFSKEKNQNSDRNVKKITTMPALDLSRLVPLYKRITTTYWSRDNISGQHQPKINPKNVSENQHNSPENEKSGDKNKQIICADGSIQDNIDNFLGDDSSPNLRFDQDDEINTTNIKDFIENSFLIEKNDTQNSSKKTPQNLSIDPNLANNSENFSTISPKSPQSTCNYQPRQQLGIPTSTVTHALSPQTAISTLSHLLCPTVIATIEADIYWLFTLLIDIVQDNYINKQPGIHRMITKLDLLCRRIDPSLSEFLFKKNNVIPIQFAFRWFNCLFVRELPFQYAARLWDVALSNLYVKKNVERIDFGKNQNFGIKNEKNEKNGKNEKNIFGNKKNQNSSIINTLTTTLDSHSTTNPLAYSYDDCDVGVDNDDSDGKEVENGNKNVDKNNDEHNIMNEKNNNTNQNNSINNQTEDEINFLLVSTTLPNLDPITPSHTNHLSNHLNDHHNNLLHNRRTDIDIESFEDCFVFFGASLLIFFRKIFFTGLSTSRDEDEEEIYFNNHHINDDDSNKNNNINCDDSTGGITLREFNKNPSKSAQNNNSQINSQNNKNFTSLQTFSPIDFTDFQPHSSCPVEILDTPSIYHYHLSGVPFSVLTGSSGNITAGGGGGGSNFGAVFGGSGPGSSAGNSGNNSQHFGNFGQNSGQTPYISNDTSITLVTNHYPSILYLSKELVQQISIDNSLNNDNFQHNSQNNHNFHQNNPNWPHNTPDPTQLFSDSTPSSNPANHPDLLHHIHDVSPDSLHTIQQELLYNNIYRHHTDCVHNHQYEKNTTNITISLQYIDPVSHSAITTITKPDQTSVTHTTQAGMIGNTVFHTVSQIPGANPQNNGNNSQIGNNNQHQLVLSPHGIAITNNAAYIELGLPKKWVLDNFGDIIIFVQQHVPTITQSLWVNEDLETCLSEMYLLQSTFYFGLPNA